MADILPTLLQFPPAGGNSKKKLSSKEYDTQIGGYLRELGKIKPVQFTKTHDKKNLLDLLDPATNSLAYMIAFNRQVSSAGKDSRLIDNLSTYAINFLYQFDPIQVRYAGEEWRHLFETVCATLSGTGATDISPVVTGLLRLDPTAGTFTNNHLRLVHLALRLGVPSQVVPILDKNIHAYPSKPPKGLPTESLNDELDFSNTFISQKSGLTTEVKPEGVLTYYYLGGTIYLALENYTRARLFLETVLLSPSTSKTPNFSALQLEAYRKWLMLGLLVDGKQFPYLKTIDAGVIKNIRTMAAPYEALVADFEKRDAKKYEADMDVAGTVWADDGNLRLVREVALALQRYKVIDLQTTYAALPVTRVAELMEMEEDLALLLLKDMIQSGSLLASLSQDGSVLTFHSSEAKLPEQAVEGSEDLEARTMRITGIIESVREADRRLQLTKEYVDFKRKEKKAGGSGGEGDLADVMDLEYDNPAPPMMGNLREDDEDLMQT